VPNYVHYFKTDWGYAALTPAEQTIARRYEALFRADPGVTADWLAKHLGAASAELSDRRVYAYGEDDDGPFALSALDGTYGDDPDPRDHGEDADITRLLTADDYRAGGVTAIWTMLFWPRPLLDAVIAKANELDVSASWIVQSSWKLAGGRCTDAKLGYDPNAGRASQSLFLLVDQWAEIMERVAREDRGASWFVQRAVVLALPHLTRG